MQIKRCIVWLLAFSIIFAIGGCSPSSLKIENGDFIFNRSSIHLFDADDYIVLNIDDGYLYEKEAKRLIPLKIDPLERYKASDTMHGTDNSSTVPIFTSRKQVYILNNLNKENILASDFQIEALNLNSLSKETIFQTISPNSKDEFLGLKKLFKQTNNYDFEFDENGVAEITSIGTIFHFFIYNNFLYTEENYQIHCYNLKNGKNKVIVDDRIKGESIAFDGKNIYYLTMMNDLCFYNIEHKNNGKLIENKIAEYYISENYIFFKNLSDNGALYRYDKASAKIEKISDIVCQSIQSDEKYIFFTDPQTEKIYRIGRDGKDCKVIIDQAVSDFIILSDSNNIVFTVENNVSFSQSTSVYIANKDGENQYQIM